MQFRLSICIFTDSAAVAQSLAEILGTERYSLTVKHFPQELISYVEQNKEQIDCLIFLNDAASSQVLNQLHEQGILLPIVIIEPGTDSLGSFPSQTKNAEASSYIYHSGEIQVKWLQVTELSNSIEQAITQFLHLGPSCALSEKPQNLHPNEIGKTQTFLLLQQRRLAEKLKERLGYLGVYYKRNPQDFYRNLSEEDKKQFFREFTEEYRYIILNYFSKDEDINQRIDQFVNRAFFADLSVSQILETHMELMDEFAQQLKLEGRSEEILLDYRLTLIDIIAHLCEMFRRSIPREDVPFELLFQID